MKAKTAKEIIGAIHRAPQQVCRRDIQNFFKSLQEKDKKLIKLIVVRDRMGAGEGGENGRFGARGGADEGDAASAANLRGGNGGNLADGAEFRRNLNFGGSGGNLASGASGGSSGNLAGRAEFGRNLSDGGNGANSANMADLSNGMNDINLTSRADSGRNLSGGENRVNLASMAGLSHDMNDVNFTSRVDFSGNMDNANLCGDRNFKNSAFWANGVTSENSVNLTNDVARVNGENSANLSVKNDQNTQSVQSVKSTQNPAQLPADKVLIVYVRHPMALQELRRDSWKQGVLFSLGLLRRYPERFPLISADSPLARVGEVAVYLDKYSLVPQCAPEPLVPNEVPNDGLSRELSQGQFVNHLSDPKLREVLERVRALILANQDA